MQYFGFHSLNLFYVNSSFQNYYKNKHDVTFKINSHTFANISLDTSKKTKDLSQTGNWYD